MSPTKMLSLFALLALLGNGLPLWADSPVARWEFEQEEVSKLTAVGGAHRDVPGPRPPEFPDMDSGNLAVKLDGRGARYTLEDPGANSPFDFTNGETISLEAWVKLDDIKPGENLYVIGKGRTGAAGFAAHNQNWALRIRESNSLACVSFLFATPPKKNGTAPEAHWHRWTTTSGFAVKTGWHHIAVSYKFGEPESMRGWIDGQPQGGAWDMGGATSVAPVVDDDAIWIGSSQGGAAANSFRGALDAIAVHRAALDDKTIAGRFHRAGGPLVVRAAEETPPELDELPLGESRAIFFEGLSAHDRWRNEGEVIVEVSRWSAPALLLPRLPYRYDSWGVRESWAAPVLARLAARCELQPGQRKFLLRTRGLARLWVNGVVVARGKPHSGSSDGHNPVSPVPQPPLAGARAKGYEMQEVFGVANIPADGQCLVVLETLVGGTKFRAEPGETLVAVQSSAENAFHLLYAGQVDQNPLVLTDAVVEPLLATTNDSLASLDRQTRRELAASQDAFWRRRHDRARDWVTSNPAPLPPATAISADGDLAARHPIDSFIKAKIERARRESSGDSIAAERFHAGAHAILSAHCFRCHAEKAKGGLRLDSRDGLLAGGDSGLPAITPGKLEESELLARIESDEEATRMPPQGDGLSAEEIAALKAWAQAGAPWPAAPLSAEEVTLAPRGDDASFLRRVYFDTVGVPPTEHEVRVFLADPSSTKREAAIDRLLDDPRWADHSVSYWQDILAENPNMLKPSLNNSGPFRWFLHESLTDNKPFDRLVTELILLRGSEREGGAAGFGLAADNDAPFAAKGQIVGQAFLGIDLQCARCHDSPYHSTTQQDLYSLAAMLERKTVSVPKSNSVPAAFFDQKQREALIEVTLKPGQPVQPRWPFAQTTGVTDDSSLNALLQDPTDSRERLAALVTAPQNIRFAQVIVNRLWRRLIGAGLVEPAHDWEGRAASHPELLDWLAREFVSNGYDLKHLSRVMMTSELYQREPLGRNRVASAERRFFNAPDRRRLSAEQVVDALFAVSGQAMETEEITFDPDGRRPANTMISLGYPRRAWELASLSNERDRPSLSLPRAQAICDVLEAFGWTGARQNPLADRDTEANVLQPGVLANSIVSVWITRAAVKGAWAEMAVQAESPAELVDSLCLRVLGRLPTAAEKAPLVAALGAGFSERLTPEGEIVAAPAPSPLARVTWSNHLAPEANVIKVEQEQRARLGPPADPRLRPSWRETYEDVVWALLNQPQFVWIP